MKIAQDELAGLYVTIHIQQVMLELRLKPASILYTCNHVSYHFFYVYTSHYQNSASQQTTLL